MSLKCRISDSSGDETKTFFEVDQFPKATQILESFCLIEYDDYFEIMDQHAIHERIVFNQLAHEDRSKRYQTQTLLESSRVAFP